MNTTAKPYKTRGMVEVARTHANFYDIFPGGCIGRESMGGRGDHRAAGSMRVPASRFGGSRTLPPKIFALREEIKCEYYEATEIPPTM